MLKHFLFVAAHGPLHVAVRILFLQCGSFVIELLATAQADLDLGSAVALKIYLQRQQGKAFFLSLADQFLDLYHCSHPFGKPPLREPIPLLVAFVSVTAVIEEQ